MQKSSQMMSADYVINKVWQIISCMRSGESTSDALTTALLYLYSFHKGYGVYEFHKEYSIYPEYDFLCGDLETFSLDSEIYSTLKDKKLNRELHDFMESLSEVVTTDEFNSIYVPVLKGLFELACINAGRQEGEILTPYAITRLMAYFVKNNGCQSVYDPFCGTASIVHYLSDGENVVKFEGQELINRTSLYARINAEAVYGDDQCINIGDSICQWDQQHFDAIVSCPPFAMKLTQSQIEPLSKSNSKHPCRTVDDLLLTRSFCVNHASMTITLHPMRFCIGGQSDGELRKYLIDNNLLDMVIALPANLLYGTSIPCVLVICKQGRDKSAPITIVRAQDYVLGTKRDKVFDIERFFSMIEGNKQDCVSISREDVLNFNYSLAPELYGLEQIELKDGQQLVKLGDVLKEVSPKRGNSPVDNVITLSCLSSDFISVRRNKNMTVKPNGTSTPTAYRTIQNNGKSYLLTSFISDEKRYGIYTTEGNLSFSPNMRAFQIEDTIISPEYLVHVLLENKAFTKGSMPLSGYLNMQIVIDNPEKQRMIVEELLQRYYEQAKAEQDADAKRLGVKRHISDLEHMLGSTQQKINRIFSRLEKDPTDVKRQVQLIKSLKDNFDYMNRIIHFTNSDIDSETFNLKQCNIVKFIESYAESWQNYGGPYFELQLVNETGSDVTANCDTTMLTVMFDSILSNAVRHGFNKNKNHTPHNLLQISMSLVQYKEAPYVLLSFANNGDSFAENFTLKDYISKGRYSTSTGRSGLGGYHVFRIAKGHNGYIYLDSNKMWNVVVEVLLPLNDFPANQILSEYEHECI